MPKVKKVRSSVHAILRDCVEKALKESKWRLAQGREDVLLFAFETVWTACGYPPSAEFSDFERAASILAGLIEAESGFRGARIHLTPPS